jgi:transposase
MEVLHARCAGLDVHKDVIVACVRIHEGTTARHEVESFGSTSKALHVAMEATGVYWKSVWHVLEGDFELVLANCGERSSITLLVVF